MKEIFAGISRGVPMLFIPFFADQNRNALKTQQNGHGLMLPFTKITTESLSAALKELLTNQKYADRAKEMARLFNDNLVHPLDEAVFWIEYAMRSKGATFLKSYAVHMSWFSYLLLDILLLPVGVGAFIYIWIKLLCRVLITKQNTPRKTDKKTK